MVDESSPVKDLLKSGDIITEVNGNKIKNEVDFYDLIFENQDTQINVKVIRDGQETIIKIK